MIPHPYNIKKRVRFGIKSRKLLNWVSLCDFTLLNRQREIFSAKQARKNSLARKRTLPENKGTTGCFLLGRLSLKRNKPKKGHVWRKTKMIIPWGIPLMVALSPGGDITPIKGLK